MHAVEICDCCEEAVAAVGVAIAPVLEISTFGYIVNRLESFARLTIENREIFRSGDDSSVYVSPVGLAVADETLGSVDRSIAGLAYEFRTSVAIEVIYHELSVVGTRADVFSEVYSPESCSVEFVAVEDSWSGESVVGVVVGVCRVPFENYLVFAVSIHIADRSVVGCVMIFFAEDVYSEFGRSSGMSIYPRGALAGRV